MKFDEIMTKFYMGKTALNTTSQEAYDKLMRFLEKRGYRWNSGALPTKPNYYDTEKTNTCVSICGNRIKNLFMRHYKEDGYIIIPIDSSDFPPDKFTKADLKSGMVVERKDGERRLCIDIGGKVMLLNPKGWINNLSRYDNNLCHTCNHAYDIVAIKKVEFDQYLPTMLSERYNEEPSYIYKRKEIDWSKISVDTLVQVLDTDTGLWYNAYFAGVDEYGNITVFSGGCTSKTHQSLTVINAKDIRIAE